MMNPAIPQEEPALVCTNIGPRERRKRLYFGIAAEVMALAVLAAVKILKLSGWTAAITLPFFIAAGIGFFQWLEKTCIANVYLGVTNMDDGNVAVTGTPGAAFTLPDVVLYAGAFVFLFGATLTEP